MLMKKIIACLFILWGAEASFAQSGQTKSTRQARPDLSGTWELNVARSDLRDDRYALSLNEAGVTILHHDPEFKLERRFRQGNLLTEDSIFYTDGRGESNATQTSQGTVKSSTRWEGRKLVSRYALRRVVAGKQETVDVVDEWSLSGDGRTLTLVTTLRYILRATDAEHRPPFRGYVPRLWLKRVYDRAP